MAVRDPSTSPVVPAPASPIVTTVASIAALKALAGTDITGTVEVLSRIASAIPDGLGGIYTWNSTDIRTDDSATLATIIQPNSGGVGRWNPATVAFFNQSGTGAVARTVQSKEREQVSLFDFMSAAQIADVQAGTALVDITAAIQAALTAAHTNGFGHVYGPAGTYLTGEIEWPGNNITLRGAGSASSYNTSATPRTVFKAKAGTVIVFDLVQTGTSEDRTGNHLCDFAVDGASIAAVGIKSSGANIIERVQARGCTTAGVLLSNFTNGTRVRNCGLNSNSGWGLKVDGVSTTDFSVEGTFTSLNTAGGILLESGFAAVFRDGVSESNIGPGLKIDRPAVNTNKLGNITFDTYWLEDNASVGPFFTIQMDAFNTDPLRAIRNVTFRKCKISPSVVTLKHLLCGNVIEITLDHCAFSGSTASDAITLTSSSVRVAFIESANTYGVANDGLSATQLDNAIAQGTRCYSSDRDVRRVVGSGAPAAAFVGTWINEASGNFPTAKYWFDREGNVCLEGAISTGTINTDAFVLPVGYRPSKTNYFPAVANDAFGAIEIQADGSVIPRIGSNVIFSLNGVKFPTS